VWQLGDAAPQLVSELAGIGGTFRPLGFSSDGRRIALHVDGEAGRHALRVWDTRSGGLAFTADEVNDSARFDPRGTWISAIDAGGVVTVYDAAHDTATSSFVGEQLSRAQVDPTGKLVVALDKLGQAVLVLDASDGRTLARWPVVHPPPRTTEDTVVLPRGGAWWTRDGRAIVARSGDVTVWDVQRAELDATIVAHAQRQVPWRVVDGRLEWVRVTLRGRVTYRGEPAPWVRVIMKSREVPSDASSVSWNTAMSHQREVAVTTDGDGQFVLRDVLHGAYTIVARRGTLSSATIDGSTLDARDEPLALELR
jgi:hypothetical protein